MQQKLESGKLNKDKNTKIRTVFSEAEKDSEGVFERNRFIKM